MKSRIELKPVMRDEIETVWRMQVEAFSGLLEKYQDYETSPAAEEMKSVAARFEQPGSKYYFIMAGDKPVKRSISTTKWILYFMKRTEK